MNVQALKERDVDAASSILTDPEEVICDGNVSVKPPKILTRLDIGGLQIAHRVILSGKPQWGAGGAERHGRLVTSGGLVISAPIVMHVGTKTHLQPSSGWRDLLAATHAGGGMMLARLRCTDDPVGPPATDGSDAALATCRNVAGLVGELGFDGIEFDVGLRLPAPAFVLEMTETLLQVWGSDRTGVRVPVQPPGTSGPSADDDALEEIAAGLNDLEVAFLQLDGSTLAGSGPRAAEFAAAQTRVRAAFRWPIIACCRVLPNEAAALVESRCVDAVCFPDAEDGPALLRAVVAVTQSS